MSYYTYLYTIDGRPAYVGKGAGTRRFHHAKANAKSYFSNALRKAYREDALVAILSIPQPSEEAAFAEEKRLIALYGRKDLGTGTLYNLTEGGEGASGATFNRGRVHSPEKRARMGAPRGRTLSPEHIAKVTEQTRGQKRSAETKARQSAAMLGKPSKSRDGLVAYHQERARLGLNVQTEASKLKRSIALKAYWAKRREQVVND